MKKFQFTLEAVRTLRQRQEQTAMEQYAHALLARRQAVSRLESVQQEMLAGWRELRDMLTRGCAAACAVRAQDYHQVLATRRDECATALAIAERRATAALNAMSQARQQSEIVETHFKKQKVRHHREELGAEQKMLDDLASRRANSVLSWNPTEALT